MVCPPAGAQPPGLGPLWLQPYPDALLDAQLPAAGRDSAPAPRSARERELTTRFADAFEAADADGLVALLTEDAWLTMPPEPLEYQGHAAIAEFFRTRPHWKTRVARLVLTRANNQPAYGYYRANNQPAYGYYRADPPAPPAARPTASSCSRWPATGSAPSPGSATTACSPASGCPGPCRTSRIRLPGLSGSQRSPARHATASQDCARRRAR